MAWRPEESTLSRAERIIGTSAGAMVGARLAASGAAGLMAPEFLATPESFGPPPPPSAAPTSPRDMAPFVAAMTALGGARYPGCAVRSRVGRWASELAPLLPEERFVESFSRRLPDKLWPSRLLASQSTSKADNARSGRHRPA